MACFWAILSVFWLKIPDFCFKSSDLSLARYGMKPLADLLNGARLMGMEGQIGQLKPGYFADVIAVAASRARRAWIFSSAYW